MKKFSMLILLSLLSTYAMAGDYNIVVAGQSNAYYLADQSQGIIDRFAEAGRTVNIIRCAKGGTSIEKFAPNWISGSIYGDCMEAIGNRKIDSVIFWQGEADSKRPHDVVMWPRRFMAFIRALRSDTGNPRLPVVVALLNGRQHRWAPYWVNMRMTQARIRAPFIFTLDTNNAQFLPDDVHLTPYGYYEIGREFADVLLQQFNAGHNYE